MRKAIFVGVSLAVGVALVATVAFAWGPGFGRGPGFGPPFANLTPEQSSQIQDLREAFLKDIGPMQQTLWAKEAELRKLWKTPDADPALIVARQKEILELRTHLQERANQVRLDVQKLLPATK